MELLNYQKYQTSDSIKTKSVKLIRKNGQHSRTKSQLKRQTTFQLRSRIKGRSQVNLQKNTNCIKKYQVGHYQKSSLSKFVDSCDFHVNKIFQRCKIQNQMYFSSEQLEKMDIGQPIGLPTSQKSKNRLYLSWRNSKGIDCKMIGPQTKCFCNHKFKDHDYLNAKSKKAPCTSAKCKCKCFDYIPSHGAYDFKCLCKHSFKEHDCITKKCTKEKCNQCTGFASAWTCSCSHKFTDHQTIIETYEQRKQKGKSLNDMGRLNEQLNHMSEEGSLLKPIKMDPQQRAKLRRSSQNNPYLVGYGSKKQIQQDELQQYNIHMNFRK